MPTLSNPPVRTLRETRSAPEWTSSQAAAGSGQFLNTPGFKLRPLQVTWEMTQACDWKSEPIDAGAASARDRNWFSTAQSLHLVEEFAAMHVPLLALTGTGPLLRPAVFPSIEF